MEIPKKRSTKKYSHVCVFVERAIEELKKGNNIFDCSTGEILPILVDKRNKGIKFHTGCDNEKEDGKCGSHPACDFCDNEIAENQVRTGFGEKFVDKYNIGVNCSGKLHASHEIMTVIN